MKTTLNIQNLKCSGCEAKITQSLSKLESIENVKIDYSTNAVSFEFKIKENLGTVKTMLSKLGYPIVGEKNDLTKKVKSYISCAIGRTIA